MPTCARYFCLISATSSALMWWREQQRQCQLRGLYLVAMFLLDSMPVLSPTAHGQLMPLERRSDHWRMHFRKKVHSYRKGIATKLQPKFAGEGPVQSSPSKPHQSLIVSLNANAPANATAPTNANASLTLHQRILIHQQTSEHHQMLTPSTNADTLFHVSASLNDNASANATSKKAHKRF